MKKKLVVATNNAHKLEEIAAILGDEMELLSLKDIKCFADIPETADTLEGNARQKAMYIYENYGMDCFADDTGLEVDALNGAPGVYSARYAGDGHDSEANMQKLLHELEGKKNRKAQFRTAICLIQEGKEYLFEGIVKGEIIQEKRGGAGFGYDPIFVPEGYEQTFAELGNDVKNTISHRARAVEKLCLFLKK
ncbi:MAG: non-canonical purine NTP diphosphatase [Bacteroides sp.]|nr:non-canonical purine NTP diphosphatase [Bacteroides sp.]MBQ3191121.1 non-canonical purine NTP diphosphatase [Bacteroides sp.]MBQ7350332.1 non-canonical purine NTP diphosphatase [Bacteroides sp.]